MIQVSVVRMQSTGYDCFNPDCKRNPEYHYNIVGQVWHIKVGHPVAFIFINNNHEVYCRDCIDTVYLMLKSKLDSRLWNLE